MLTALRKEPARRYASAADLAEDIRRHLDGRPVLARNPTWRYRSIRFVQRHRGGVAMTTVLVAIIIGFAATLVVQNRSVRAERDAAEQVTTLLLELYSAYDPTASRGSVVTARELLDRGASRIQVELHSQPEMQARMLDRFGELYNNLGLSDRAVDVLRSSLAARESAGDTDSITTAQTLTHLAVALTEDDRPADAEAFAERAVGILRRRAPDSAELAEALNPLGVLRDRRGAPEGVEMLTESIELWRKTKGVDSFEFAGGVGSIVASTQALSGTAVNLVARADLLKAERFERELLIARRQALGDVHLLTARSLHRLGLLLRAMDRHAEAEPLLQEALATRRQLLGDDDRIVARTREALTRVRAERTNQ